MTSGLVHELHANVVLKLAAATGNTDVVHNVLPRGRVHNVATDFGSKIDHSEPFILLPASGTHCRGQFADSSLTVMILLLLQPTGAIELCTRIILIIIVVIFVKCSFTSY